jgi:hypothetical protein
VSLWIIVDPLAADHELAEAESESSTKRSLGLAAAWMRN